MDLSDALGGWPSGGSSNTPSAPTPVWPGGPSNPNPTGWPGPGGPSNPNQPGWPAGGSSNPSQPGWPAGGSSNPSQPGWPAGGSSNPSQPGWPAGGSSNPSQPGWPAGGSSNPSQPGWPAGGSSNPSQPGWPAGGSSNPSQPGWPAGGSSNPSQPGWPAGGPGQPAPGPGQTKPLKVPYNHKFQYGLQDGMVITANGRVNPHANMFTIDFTTSRDLAFHFNARFNENGKKVIVRNGRTGDKWGKEERTGGFPFVQGQPFEIKVQVTREKYNVAVNGKHLLEFRHQVKDLHSVTNMSIYNDISLTNVSVG